MRDVVELLVGRSSSGDAVYEEVLVEKLGANRCRLLRSPGLALGIAADDLIEIAERGHFKVVQRGRNVCVQILSSDRIDDSVEREASTRFTRVGGRLDGRAEKVLVFTIPVDVGFRAIEEVLGAVLAKFRNLEWYYGNVYDPADGVTPLNWW
jgi:hypothetical protein